MHIHGMINSQVSGAHACQTQVGFQGTENGFDQCNWSCISSITKLNISACCKFCFMFTGEKIDDHDMSQDQLNLR